MKKKSIAAVLAVASGALHAQSTVTLFGVVDLAVSHYSTTSRWYDQRSLATASLVTPPDIKRSQTALSSGANATSRLGFRGTEDLGGGLAASFWLESGITADDGGKSLASFFDRRSTVSLSGPFGEVRLGRDYTPTYWNDTTFDPFGPVGVGTSVLSKVNQNIAVARGTGVAPYATDNAIRSSNSVGYFLPRDLGGLYGQVMYAFHENVKESIVAGSPSKRGEYVGGRFGYAEGPLDVAVSYGESTGDNYPGIDVTRQQVDDKVKIVNLGASYDFGVARLMGAISRTEADIRAATGNTRIVNGDTYTGGLIGISVPIGVGLVKVAYSRMESESQPPTGAPSVDASVNKFAIGYVHNLSKRTALYATASRVRIHDGQNNPVILGLTTGGAPTYTSTGGGVAGYAPYSATGYDFGLRHTF